LPPAPRDRQHHQLFVRRQHTGAPNLILTYRFYFIE
jgi:hypothetical protein